MNRTTKLVALLSVALVATLGFGAQTLGQDGTPAPGTGAGRGRRGNVPVVTGPGASKSGAHCSRSGPCRGRRPPPGRSSRDDVVAPPPGARRPRSSRRQRRKRRIR